MHITKVTPIFAWGGPASHNPLTRHSRPVQPNRAPVAPQPRHTDNRWQPRNALNKSFYIPRAKPDFDLFRSFSYPATSTQQPMSPNRHRAREPTHACLCRCHHSIHEQCSFRWRWPDPRDGGERVGCKSLRLSPHNLASCRFRPARLP
jgi:hypothetical protein